MSGPFSGHGLCEFLDRVDSNYETCDRPARVILRDEPTNTSLAACQIHALSILEEARRAGMGQFATESDDQLRATLDEVTPGERPAQKRGAMILANVGDLIAEGYANSGSFGSWNHLAVLALEQAEALREVASWCIDPWNKPGFSQKDALHALEAMLRNETWQLRGCRICAAVGEVVERTKGGHTS